MRSALLLAACAHATVAPEVSNRPEGSAPRTPARSAFANELVRRDLLTIGAYAIPAPDGPMSRAVALCGGQAGCDPSIREISMRSGSRIREAWLVRVSQHGETRCSVAMQIGAVWWLQQGALCERDGDEATGAYSMAATQARSWKDYEGTSVVRSDLSDEEQILTFDPERNKWAFLIRFRCDVSSSGRPECEITGGEPQLVIRADGTSTGVDAPEPEPRP